jgi:hypothetical protein
VQTIHDRKCTRWREFVRHGIEHLSAAVQHAGERGEYEFSAPR